MDHRRYLEKSCKYDTEILKREEAKMSLEKRLALQYEMMRCRNGKISL